MVTAVAGESIDDLADLWRKLWATGEAGVSIKLTLSRDGRAQTRVCMSADRTTFLKQPLLH